MVAAIVAFKILIIFNFSFEQIFTWCLLPMGHRKYYVIQINLINWNQRSYSYAELLVIGIS